MQIIKESDPKAIDLACKFLREGKLVVFASDTVYGIAADASNYEAVEKLYKIKERDISKPIAIFLKDMEMAKKIFYFGKNAAKIATKLLPGSLTMVLKTKSEADSFFSQNLNKNNDGFVGFRIIDKKFVNKLLENFAGIIAVSSANKSNFEAAKNCSEVVSYFTEYSSKELLIIDGGSTTSQASTVIKFEEEEVKILRLGAITKEKIFELL